MNKIFEFLIKKQSDSWIRDLATAAGSWLAGSGIATHSVEEALAGGLLLAYSLLAKAIDVWDGPTDIATNILRITIGPRVRDLAMSCSRWAVLVVVGFIHGLDPDFDATGLADGSIVSGIGLLLTFAVQRGMKYLPALGKRAEN